MSKRGAAVQLTSDNAEEQDTLQEEAGEFEIASQEQIQQRIIKKAKRGRGLDQASSSSSPGIGIGGIFAKLKQSLSSSSSGSVETKINFSSSSTQAPFQPISSKSATSSSLSAPLTSVATSTPPTRSAPPNDEYLKQLCSLNTSVTQWISEHVDKNPYVDLTPIFKDYETHLSNIDKKYNITIETDTDKSEESCDTSSSMRQSSTSEGEDSETRNADSQSEVGSVAEVEEVEPKTDKESSTNMNGTGSVNDGTSSPPVLNLSSPSDSNDDGALFTVRTKLFYKKGSEYIDLGVGTLKVQSASGGSVHLLMRNDTSLGSILLNIKVVANMPMWTNKKSVLLVCPTPNPPLSVGEGPVTYLLRVKTAELAEQLLKVIKEHTDKS